MRRDDDNDDDEFPLFCFLDLIKIKMIQSTDF
jgi:hypothetical protein